MNLARVDLNLLVAFEAMMTERSVSRAAKRIGLAQSSMSNALGRLRALFDDELFIRTPTGMQPTLKAIGLSGPVGDALYHVRAALGMGSEVFDPRTARRTFWIGAVDFADATLLPDFIAAVREEAPNVNISVSYLQTEEAISKLDEGAVDLVVGSLAEPPKRVDMALLHQERLVCVMREGHPAPAGEWTPRTFALLPHLIVRSAPDMSDPVDGALAQLGLSRRVVARVPSHMVVPFVLRQCDLVACATEGVARYYAEIPGIAIYDPPMPLPIRQIYMLWSRPKENAFGMEWLRNIALEVARRYAETKQSPLRANRA